MIVLHYDDHDVADVDDDDVVDDAVVDDVVDVDGVDLVVAVVVVDDDDDDDDWLAVAAYNIIPPPEACDGLLQFIQFFPPDSRVILTMSFSTELKVSMENHYK